MVRNTVQNAAYEGARRGVLPGATVTECRSEAANLLDMVGIGGYTITVLPITPASDRVTVIGHRSDHGLPGLRHPANLHGTVTDRDHHVAQRARLMEGVCHSRDGMARSRFKTI